MNRAIPIAFLAIALSACSPSTQNAESFDRRARCDELVRSKFSEMEHRFSYKAVTRIVTSNYSAQGECYGLLERNGSEGSNEILIEGTSGKELANIARAGDFLITGLRDGDGTWIDKGPSGRKEVEEFITRKMNER